MLWRENKVWNPNLVSASISNEPTKKLRHSRCSKTLGFRYKFHSIKPLLKINMKCGTDLDNLIHWILLISCIDKLFCYSISNDFCSWICCEIQLFFIAPSTTSFSVLFLMPKLSHIHLDFVNAKLFLLLAFVVSWLDFESNSFLVNMYH